MNPDELPVDEPDEEASLIDKFDLSISSTKKTWIILRQKKRGQPVRVSPA